MIQVDCPGCGKSYRISPQLAGRRGTCRQCRVSFSIPNTKSAAIAAPQPDSKQPRPPMRSSATNELLQLLEESIAFPKQPVTLDHRAAGLLVACTMLVLPIFYVLF